MQVYKFFNSGVNDPRTYQASDFADYFGSVLSTGLLHTDEVPGMAVSVITGTLKTSVSAGKAIMKGHLYENTEPLELTHSIPEATLDRIDRIILRLDLRNAERNILLQVKEGVAATSPVAPSLQRDNFIYEISLAQIRVRANTVQLLTVDMIDERLDEDICGLVYSLISVPTDQFLGKLQQFQEEWDFWFSNIQGELPNEASLVSVEDVAGYFDNQNVEGVLAEIYRSMNQHIEDEFLHNIPLKVTRTNKDANGVFTTVEYQRRKNDSLYARDVLSGGTSPQYTTRTVTYFAQDGTTVTKTEVSTITYDADGDWTVD